MLYSKLVDLYESLERTSARLAKIDAVAKLLRQANTENLPRVVMLIQGRVLPPWSEKEIGIAEKMVVRIVSTATGFGEDDVMARYRNTGDLGTTVEQLMQGKRQQTLGAKRVDIEKVFENLRKLATVEGKGSQDVKVNIVKELIMHSPPREAKYIVRTALGQLRIGVAQGVMRDAIARAFFPDKQGDDKHEVIRSIEWAWFLRPDYSEVACIAKKEGLTGLNKATLQLGKPFHVLLADKAPSLKDALEAYDNLVIETKYDGARIQAHKDGDKVWLFTRRLEDVTVQFPDLVKMVRGRVTANKCIIEGEAVAVDPKTGRPVPFQTLSQRIHRKYEIDRMVKEIPVQMNWFDIVYLEGEQLFEKAFKERRRLLEGVLRSEPGKFQAAEQLKTKDLAKAEHFYEDALYASQEGVMVKNLDARYQPGKRVAGGWLKVKPIMETLDLVIVGAQWGTGKRAGWLGSFVLGCRDPDSGDFLECGMMGTGVKEKRGSGSDITFKDLTKMLKPDISVEHGNRVKIKPRIVLEVAYEEIQKSPNYDSGFALRFPRLVKLRPDKSPQDADDTGRISRLYKQQKGGR